MRFLYTTQMIENLFLLPNSTLYEDCIHAIPSTFLLLNSTLYEASLYRHMVDNSCASFLLLNSTLYEASLYRYTDDREFMRLISTSQLYSL